MYAIRSYYEQGIPIGDAPMQIANAHRQRHIRLDGRQGAREQYLLLEFLELGGKTLGAAKAELGYPLRLRGYGRDIAHPLQQRYRCLGALV